MKKYIIISLVSFLLPAVIISSYANTIKERVPLKLHIDSIVVDSHNDTMMKIIDESTWLPVLDLRNDTDLHIDIPKLRAGNIKVSYFAAYSSSYHGRPNTSASRTLALINALYYTQRNNSDIFKIVKSYKELERAVLDKKIAAVATIEGAYSITRENSTSLVNQYYDLGIRSIGFTWNYSNELAEGLYRAYGDRDGTRSPKGLTSLGKDMVRELNDLGIIIDVSHLSPDSFYDVITITRSPIIASHSGAISVFNHPRNLDDFQLRKIQENNGVVGVVYHEEFVSGVGTSYVANIVDHIDHIVNLIGVDHVGLGSDFDGAHLPNDLQESSKVYRITEELLRRGYSDSDIKKILGLNHLRVFKENENNKKIPGGIQDLNITPHFNMGDSFSKDLKTVTARVSGNLKDIRFRGILNGVEKKIELNEDKLILSIDENLTERFYVVSFEAENKDGKILRETRIINIR